MKRSRAAKGKGAKQESASSSSSSSSSSAAPQEDPSDNGAMEVDIGSADASGNSGAGADGGVEQSEGERFYQSKLEALAAEQRSVEDGTHAELVLGEKALAVTKDRRLRDAELHRKLRIKEIEELYKFDCQSAEEVYDNALTDLKSRLSGEIEESSKRMEGLREGAAEADVRASSRKLRSKGGELVALGDDGIVGENGSKAAAATGTPGGYGPESLGIDFFMTEEAIGDDLRQIQRDWKSRAEKFIGQEQISTESVKVVDGVLYYNEHIMEKDCAVVCHTEVTKEQIYGNIKSMTPSEVLISVCDGTQTRVLLTHLRSGRCSIAPAPDED